MSTILNGPGQFSVTKLKQNPFVYDIAVAGTTANLVVEVSKDTLSWNELSDVTLVEGVTVLDFGSAWHVRVKSGPGFAGSATVGVS